MLSTPTSTHQRVLLRIKGIVQGVGFRPFVYGLAHRHRVVGFVGNDSCGVFVEVEGNEDEIAAFKRDLLAETPPLAHIEDITSQAIPIRGDTTFTIVHSRHESGAVTLVSPDLCICDDCLQELFDPNNRRYRYPFTNCTNCGPRFTIIRALPYDRPFTTMSDFPLCADCNAEYHNPYDRRFHAQPNACPNCGPQLEYVEGTQHFYGETCLEHTRRALLDGKIIAVKGLGGFHLACDATNEAAVQLLRQRKRRPHKPLAVMAYDLEAACELARINSEEAECLISRERPIILLRKRDDSCLAPSVAPHIRNIGLMLPYTPLHYLLLHDLGIPLVMTSGNLSSEPIITDNEDALTKLAPLVDGFLLHNRDIYIPCDDSVVQMAEATEVPVRRSRGYAPFPIKLLTDIRQILAVGGELKNTFCITRDSHAFLSHHIGDMENLETFNAFSAAFQHMQKLFRVQPQIVACDMHPMYLSSRWATEYADQHNIPVIRVQHHHAHIAALMAEHGLGDQEPFLGICFDGTGYGIDGTIWGGEVMIANYTTFERTSHLRYMPLVGGDTSIKKPYRIALSYLHAAGIDWEGDLPPVAFCSEVEKRILRQQLERKVNTVPTSSMGRLFDAVASLIGLRHIINYEAQAAMELETVTAFDDELAYEFSIDEKSIDPTLILQEIVNDLRAGVPPSVIAGRFHQTIAHIVLEIALRTGQNTGINRVGLTGGVFQNISLLRLIQPLLEQAGFAIFTHHKVPANDGGLALGQAIIAHHQVNCLAHYTVGDVDAATQPPR